METFIHKSYLFFLIENNYYKNLNNLFNECNLKVKKIISKSFIKGVNLINDYHNTDNFFLIEIGKITSKLYFLKILHLNLYKILSLEQI